MEFGTLDGGENGEHNGTSFVGIQVSQVFAIQNASREIPYFAE